MPFAIRLMASATAELQALRAFDQRKIMAGIAQLVNEPVEETKNRKCLDSVSPGFEYDAPLWELRVGDFRVFYDVAEEEEIVTIRAVRRKKPKDRTEDIIQ